MSKTVTICFSIENTYDNSELHRALNADAAYGALWQISQEIFRPARKHGYPNSDIEKAITEKDSQRLIELLEECFFEILEDNEIDLDRDCL